jgi:hypothetical protein
MSTALNRISDYSLNHGITMLDQKPTGQLAPAARPRGLDESPTANVDERAGSNSDRELNDWLSDDLERNPDLELPAAFNAAFDAACEDLRGWLVNDQGTKPEATRTIKQAQRLLGEVRANLDLVYYYMTAIYKG